MTFNDQFVQIFTESEDHIGFYRVELFVTLEDYANVATERTIATFEVLHPCSVNELYITEYGDELAYADNVFRSYGAFSEWTLPIFADSRSTDTTSNYECGPISMELVLT